MLCCNVFCLSVRLMSCSMDSLKFVASWRGQITEAKLQVKVQMLTFNRIKLIRVNEALSLSVGWRFAVGRLCFWWKASDWEPSWISQRVCRPCVLHGLDPAGNTHTLSSNYAAMMFPVKAVHYRVCVCVFQSAVGSYSLDECISLPVYSSAERQRVVTNVQLPCAGDHDTWIQSGAALFLKQQ